MGHAKKLRSSASVRGLRGVGRTPSTLGKKPAPRTLIVDGDTLSLLMKLAKLDGVSVPSLVGALAREETERRKLTL